MPSTVRNRGFHYILNHVGTPKYRIFGLSLSEVNGLRIKNFDRASMKRKNADFWF